MYILICICMAFLNQKPHVAWYLNPEKRRKIKASPRGDPGFPKGRTPKCRYRYTCGYRYRYGYTVGSRKLEYGSGMVRAGSHSGFYCTS